VVLEIKADKWPIGKFEAARSFTSHSIELQKGDAIYLFPDGFVDEFGGEKGKKLKAKALRELLLSIQDKSLLDQSFESWRGELEQIDDICVIGVLIQ
jgi:serine phosphatase RsbU (regulator of sigma subunit)